MSRTTFYLATAISALVLSSNVIGADLSFGAIGTRTSSVYKDTPPKNNAFPFVSITSKRAYLKGTEVGYSLRPNGSPQNLALIVEYNMDGFDPDDSTNAAMQMLDKRKATAMAGVHLTYNFVFAKLVQDIGNRHDGYYAVVGAGYPINVSAWTITPSISYKYLDKKMSTHLYGVSQSESFRTGGAFPEYNSTNTKEVKVSVRGNYIITPSFSVLVGVSHTDYKDVLDSPIVTKDYSYGASAGIIYTF